MFVQPGTVADVSGSVTASLTLAIIKTRPQTGPDTRCSRAIWRPNAIHHARRPTLSSQVEQRDHSASRTGDNGALSAFRRPNPRALGEGGII